MFNLEEFPKFPSQEYVNSTGNVELFDTLKVLVRVLSSEQISSKSIKIWGSGVDVAVGLGVAVFVGLGVDVFVGLGVEVKVGSGVKVAVGLGVAVKVGGITIVGVNVAVFVGLGVDVFVGLGVGVKTTPGQRIASALAVADDGPTVQVKESPVKVVLKKFETLEGGLFGNKAGWPKLAVPEKKFLQFVGDVIVEPFFLQDPPFWPADISHIFESGT
jgi:hypothetical protein